MLLPQEFKSLSKHITASAGFVQNLVLWSEDGYFDVAMELKPLMHLWSLGVEEQFYLVYPLIVYLWWRMRLNVLILVILIAVLSFILNVGRIDNHAVSVFSFPHTRFWELMAGGLLAWINLFAHERFLYICSLRMFSKFTAVPERKNKSAISTNLMSWIGLFLTVWSFFLIDKTKLFPGWWDLLPVFGAWLIIAGGKDSWVNRKILANRVLVFIGLISYPLYLWHWPLLSFARIMESGGKTSSEIRIAAVLLAFILAWLTYRLIERPIRFGRGSWKKTAILCGIMVIVGCVGYYTYERNGLAYRTQIINKNMRLLINKNRRLFDWPDSLSKNADCLKDFRIKGIRPVHEDYCVATKKGEVDAVLIGDSHANSLSYGLSSIYKQKNKNLLMVGGSSCVPFFDTTSRRIGEKDKCAPIINGSLTYAIENPTIKTIILSLRGPLYVNGTDFSDKVTPKTIIEWTGLPGEKEQNAIFEGAMRATIKRLVNSGKQIVFVIDWPELGFNPTNCMKTKPPRRSLKIITRCAVSRKDVNTRNRGYWMIVRDVLKDYPSVKVFDPIPHLCDADDCWAIKDDQVLYRDNDHLSKHGSVYLAEKLVEEIQLF